MSLTKQTVSVHKEDAEHPWYVVDLKDVVLGRAAVHVANALRGKDRPSYTPNADCGAFVVVVNASQATLTGRKLDQKLYHRHSGFAGGIKSEPARVVLARKSELAVRQAVWGMLPKGALGRRLITKLKVYAGANHPHGAQNPVALAI